MNYTSEKRSLYFLLGIVSSYSLQHPDSQLWTLKGNDKMSKDNRVIPLGSVNYEVKRGLTEDNSNKSKGKVHKQREVKRQFSGAM